MRCIDRIPVQSTCDGMHGQCEVEDQSKAKKDISYIPYIAILHVLRTHATECSYVLIMTSEYNTSIHATMRTVQYYNVLVLRYDSTVILSVPCRIERYSSMHTLCARHERREPHALMHLHCAYGTSIQYTVDECHSSVFHKKRREIWIECPARKITCTEATMTVSAISTDTRRRSSMEHYD